MADKPICPLEWDSTFLQMEFDDHLLVDSFDEVINRARDLCACLDEGLNHWYVAHYDDDLIPVRPFPALLDAATQADESNAVDYADQWMLGYPDWVKQSAMSIFYGLRSAEQHNAGDMAESMRRICYIPTGIDSRIANADLYAMAAAVTAWWGLYTLRRYLDDILAGLRAVYELNPPGYIGWLREFKQYYPDDFNRLIDIRRNEFIRNEADERDWASRQLGKAKEYLAQALAANRLEEVGASLSLAEKEADRRRVADHAGVDAMNQAKQATDEFKAKIKSRAIELIQKGGKYRRGNRPNFKQLAATLVAEFSTYQTANGEERDTSENTLRTGWLPELLKDCCSSR